VIKISWVVVVIPLLLSCAKSSAPIVFSYHLDSPDEVHLMPSELGEISGLAQINDREVFCVEDEHATVFRYNFNNKEITKSKAFSDKGDFEGIEMVDTHVYVLKSNGDLYRIKTDSFPFLNAERSRKLSKILPEKCDAEGLCYDSISGRLLIACKGKAGKGKSFKGKKAIYGFDIKSMKPQKEPVYLIDVNEVREMRKATNAYTLYERFTSFGSGNKTFNPSAIAMHPIEQRLYVLSSVGRTLCILNMDGDLDRVIKLNSSVFKQPEGIAFDSKGTLYISNEARGGRANISVFYYNPNLKE